MDTKVKIFSIGLIVLVLGLLGLGFMQATKAPPGPGKYDAFAQCLKDKGAIFYGAFWCPHCQAQKKMFGSSASLLPYEECSTPNGRGQLQACIDKDIASYPTWEFADGSRLTGEVALQTLAEKTGCILPSDAPETPEATGESSSATPAQ